MSSVLMTCDVTTNTVAPYFFCIQQNLNALTANIFCNGRFSCTKVKLSKYGLQELNLERGDVRWKPALLIIKSPLLPSRPYLTQPVWSSHFHNIDIVRCLTTSTHETDPETKPPSWLSTSLFIEQPRWRCFKWRSVGFQKHQYFKWILFKV